MKKHNKKLSGFTLIELLVVVGILSILVVTSLVAIRPTKRFADTRDTRRAQDVNQLLSGVFQCAIDNKDSLEMTTCLGTHTAGETYEIVLTGATSGCDDVCTEVTSDTHCLPLDVTLAQYFVDLPIDPGVVATNHTGYSLTRHTNGMVVIEACAAENGEIKVSR